MELTRRKALLGGLATICTSSLPGRGQGSASGALHPVRSINIMNFIRAEEPREPMDLFLPVERQMALIKAHDLPATWLLQYDALVEGPFVPFLKASMPAGHELGIWFEINRRLCDDAGITWRGNPLWEWDYHVPVAYTIGYTPAERRKLADTCVATFHRIVGLPAKSVASWNLDAVTAAHLSDTYGIDAFGNCRDQLATDGFTIWGAPFAAYYPARKNAWSPAQSRSQQIATPMFRLLGQDPVYYYDKVLPYPDTMEPAWPSGQSATFVDAFFRMLASAPSQALAYAQLGQENSFGWPVMEKAYAMQMEKLASLRNGGGVVVETLGATGRRFKRAFPSTPPQAQVMLEDPFGNKPPQRTVWYANQHYRANLHFEDTVFYLRDLHVYRDDFPQPYLADTVRQHGIEQRLLAALDGYHWSEAERDTTGAGLRARGTFFRLSPGGTSTPLRLAGLPDVSETSSALTASVPLAGGGTLHLVFGSREIRFRLTDAGGSRLGLLFEWAKDCSAFEHVERDTLHYRFRDFNYSVPVLGGSASALDTGVRILAAGPAGFRLRMAQTA